MNANAKTAKSAWIAPAAAVLVSIVLAAWFYSIPESYHEHHEWPAAVAVIAFVLFLYGAANLFWASVPTGKLSQTLFSLGVVLMLLCWLALHSIPGVIVGAVVSLIGFAMLILQHRRT